MIGRRRGFTLVETLVVLAITAAFAALVLVGVSSARAAARRMHCSARLQQLALATAGYQSAHGYFPPVTVLSEGGAYRYGLWPRLLPWIEAQALADGFNFSVRPGQPDSLRAGHANATAGAARLPALLCPAEGSAWAACSYRANVGPGSTLSGVQSGHAQGAFSYAFVRRPREFFDGLSHTAFFSERSCGYGDPSAGDARFDIGGVVGYEAAKANTFAELCERSAKYEVAGYGRAGHEWWPAGMEHSQYNHALPPNAPVLDCESSFMQNDVRAAISARSAHGGGVNLALGDGSQRFVGDAIAAPAWHALSTVAGREADTGE